MSDADERALWRKAVEEAPAVVKWLETKLRGFQSHPPAPKFEQTFLSNEMHLSPYVILNVNIPLPLSSDAPQASFCVAGASAFLVNFDEESLAQLRASPVQISFSHQNKIWCQPLGVLLSNGVGPPFVPGWVVDFTMPRASVIMFQIQNPTMSPLSLRFAIHGSFRNIMPIISASGMQGVIGGGGGNVVIGNATTNNYENHINQYGA